MSAVHWLALAVALTALLWIPYVLARMATEGVWAVLDNPRLDAEPPSGWVARASAAHRNAVENLVLFAPAVGVAVARGAEDVPLVVGAAAVYVACRTGHYVVYVLGIPVLRTLTFAGGWGATLAVLYGALL
ncbi:MAG: MAPEG family protein [Myxococcales bacterium]|nr:MAPEG family protein [Myxococcales bacterium]